MQLQTLHLVLLNWDAIPNLWEHPFALAVVMVQVHVNGCKGVPAAEQQWMVDSDLDAAAEFGLSVVVADHDIRRRRDEHTHPIRFTVGAQLTLVPNAYLHLAPGPGWVAALLVGVVTRRSHSKVADA